MIVEVLAVGTELLLGQIVNSNAARIGDRLAEAGLDHFRQSVVGDNLARVAGAIREAVDRSDALVITGGIGPTQDDLTREAIAEAAGVEMAFSDDYAEQLRERWSRSGRQMPDTNLKQAEHPVGSTLLPNPKGSAPGLDFEIDGCRVFALPGVPEEMLPMLDDHVVPTLVAEDGGAATLVSRVIRTWGESESRIAEILGDLYEGSENPTVAFLASSGEIKIRLTARGSDEAACNTLIAPVEAEVVRRLGSLVYSVDGSTIEEGIRRRLVDRGWTIATAESATGGLVAGRLTSVPGASEVVVGGIVAYTRTSKESLLDVPSDVIDADGLVSEAVALAMAEGAAVRLGADVAIAVTGSAGPEPLERAPGTMVVAVRTPEGAAARTLRLPGDRERVRTYGTTSALHLARSALDGEWWSA